MAGTLLSFLLEVSVIGLKVEVIGSLVAGIWEVMNPAASVLDRLIVLVVIIHFFLYLVILVLLGTAICLSEHVLKSGLNEVQVTVVRKVATLVRVVIKGDSWVVL